MIRKIGLAGKSGSGKDLVADYINDQYSYKKIAVADAIRDEVSDFIEKLFGMFAWVPGFETVIQAFKAMVWEKPTHPAMRILLQWWGTEYRRSQDPDYWTKILAQRLDNDEWIVISDVRTPDEADVIRKAGGEVWFIERPGIDSVGIKNHYTEVALEGATFEERILNNGSIQDLQQSVSWAFIRRCSCKVS